jgi:hypothetical protein
VITSQTESAFDVSLNVLLTIFVLVIIFFVAVFLVGGYLYPIFYSLSPSAGATGIDATLYQSLLGHLRTGNSWVFYILLAIPFVFIAIKLLYEREEFSVSGWR